MSLQAAAAEVLRFFPAATAGAPQQLADHGGMSGAGIWRVAGFSGPLCLRAWPVGTESGRLDFIHAMMRQAAAWNFVPKISTTHWGTTSAEYHGRLWDLTSWMPGRADFADHPTMQRMQNACMALAGLHGAWQGDGDPIVPCPAVQRRLDHLKAWQEFLGGGWQAPVNDGNPLGRQLVRAWRVVPPLMIDVPGQLAPWTTYAAALQVCHGDPWHNNNLFQGDAVSGIVDYGAVGHDHVAADLARLLGSLAGDDDVLYAAGLEAYTKVRPLTAIEEAFVRMLDWTGTVIGAANWTLWLGQDIIARQYMEVVFRRLDILLTRIEHWQSLGVGMAIQSDLQGRWH